MGALKKGWKPCLSLRAGYVAYMLTAVVLSTLLCSLLLHLIDSARMQNANRDLLAKYDVPEDGFAQVYSSGEFLTVTFFGPDGQASGSVREQPGEDMYVIHSTENGAATIDSIVVYPSYTSRQRQMDAFYVVLYTLTFPLCYGGGAILCAMAFFRRKLKEPLSLLTGAAEKIEKNDLDFTLSYERADEMGKLCASFERMRMALSENNRQMWRAMEARKRLNAAFAHDLRTPLFVIRGYSEMLSRQSGVDFAQEQVEGMAKAIGKNVARLETFVNDMARLQKLEDISPNPSPACPKALAGQWAQAARMLCAERKLLFSCAVDALPESMSLDTGMAAQAVENLLSNAVRFAKQTVRMRVYASGHTLCVQVDNDGPPFTPAQLERAALARYTSGGDEHFGLGLYVSTILCEKHGGELTVSNTETGHARTAVSFRELLQ